jgi:hypothetical protein
VPAAPPGLAGLPGPLLQLPADRPDNRRYLLWSTAGFTPMVNGRTSFDPAFFDEVLRRTGPAACFPQRASVEFLRGIGVRTVVVHTDRPDTTPGTAAVTCPPPADPAALGVRRERRGALLVHHLRV